MNSKIITGDAATSNASATKGWFVGHFMPKETLAHSKEMEIKTWHYDEDPNYGWKIFYGTEFIIVEKGVLRIGVEIPSEVRGADPTQLFITLDGEKREWVIIPPGYTKNVAVKEAPTWGVTVRWPSAPGVNEVVGK